MAKKSNHTVDTNWGRIQLSRTPDGGWESVFTFLIYGKEEFLPFKFQRTSDGWSTYYTYADRDHRFKVFNFGTLKEAVSTVMEASTKAIPMFPAPKEALPKRKKKKAPKRVNAEWNLW